MVFSPTVIPPHTTVDGSVESPGDLDVEGRVEGAIAVGGTLTIRATAACVAQVQARTAVIYGELIGNAVCMEAIRVAAGARVVGDLRAPDVSVDADAEVDGRVDLLAPEPRGTTVQRLPLTPRGRVRRPTMPAESDAIATTPTSDRAPGGETGSTGPRTVPRAPRPSGRVRVSSRER